MALPTWISRPSPRTVRILAIAVLVTQALISVTGVTVRVTGSGLGCPTWPQCFPGSMVPVPHAEVAALHQAIEFGNRLLTGVVGFIALACLLAAWRSRPHRKRLVGLALIMPLGVVAQAVIGGMTVLVDLAWWSVSVHFMASATLIWLAAILVKATTEGDRAPLGIVTRPMRRLLVALVVVTAAVLLAGTLVTAAGPHAGDPDTPRLGFAVASLVQLHGVLVMAYVLLLAVFGVWLRSARPTKALIRAYITACVMVLVQGAIGSIQYYLGVPEVLVVLHVAAATCVIITTAVLWGESRNRGPLPHPEVPEPQESVATA
ncbi:COX15/CtaA family protein [Saccharopolyspora sp. TS4A08]|uniref:COX15/CtaA family protein n=1 Tax=Saccharopolyspora ipomoeae TaxID=3042027 RepID=A0ABT6PH54_9PSEU|nr:COX15/CtaA family protein [Saccharopolyspora sp. TS4A08]MDI2027328.1 COX15/CtaA family protein [Saccharopolyspora sp. TS4A08]